MSLLSGHIYITEGGDLMTVETKLDMSEQQECPHRENKGGSQMFHPFLIPSVIG